MSDTPGQEAPHGERSLVLQRQRATARQRRQRLEDVRELRPNVALEAGEAIGGELRTTGVVERQNFENRKFTQ